jgi:carbamoyltransferase
LRESSRLFAPSAPREDCQCFELDSDSLCLLLTTARDEARRTKALRNRETQCSAFGSRPHPCRRFSTDPDGARKPILDAMRSSPPSKACTASFNVRGEAIVCSPEHAFSRFMGTKIELRAIGNCLLRKEHQNPTLKRILPARHTDTLHSGSRIHSDALRFA